MAAWHGGLGPADGFAPEEVDAAERRLGLRLPLALREWLTLAARAGAVRWLNTPFSPQELEVRDCALVFWQECQGVGHWGVPLALLGRPDPPVYLFARDDDDQCDLQNERLSQFVAQMLLHETCALAHAMAEPLPPEHAQEVTRDLVLLGLPDWSFPAAPTRFYAGDDLLVLTAGEVDRRTAAEVAFWWVYVASRRPEALDRFLGTLSPPVRGHFRVE